MGGGVISLGWFDGDTVGDTLSLSSAMCVRASVCMCTQAAGWVRLANCLRAALLLAAVLASWQQIKSRAGAVYVTWWRASDAFQQLACLSLRADSACLFVRLSDSCSLSVRHLPVRLWPCLFLLSCFSVSHLQVCSTFSTGGVVRESTRFLFFLFLFRSGPWNS